MQIISSSNKIIQKILPELRCQREKYIVTMHYNRPIYSRVAHIPQIAGIYPRLKTLGILTMMQLEEHTIY